MCIDAGSRAFRDRKIAASLKRRIGVTCVSDYQRAFRDRKIAASLKHRSIDAYRASDRRSFRDRKIAASLKPRCHQSIDRRTSTAFRDRKIAASLKRDAFAIDMPRCDRFPRSKDRGLIEAAVHRGCILLHRLSFRDRKIAASLKRKYPTSFTCGDSNCSHTTFRQYECHSLIAIN